MIEPRSRSAWTVVRGGCVGLVVVAVVALAAFVMIGFGVERAVREQIDDPGLLDRRVAEILGTERLPRSYRATLALDAPLLGRIAVLERTGDPAPAGSVPEVFLYLGRPGLRSEVEWGREADRLLDVRGLALEPSESLTSGSERVAGQWLSYRAIRARLVERPERASDVVATLVNVSCSGDEGPVGFGIWIGQDPAPRWPPDEADFSDTPADASALADFVSSFRLCPARSPEG